LAALLAPRLVGAVGSIVIQHRFATLTLVELVSHPTGLATKTVEHSASFVPWFCYAHAAQFLDPDVPAQLGMISPI
jgi:hypothetical protein